MARSSYPDNHVAKLKIGSTTHTLDPDYLGGIDYTNYALKSELSQATPVITGLGANSIQKKSGVSLSSDNILLTIAGLEISTTPTALGEGATSLGSSYQITCTSGSSLTKPTVKLTAKNGYNFTFSLNGMAAILIQTLTDTYKAQAEAGAPSFYLKFGTNYLLITSYTDLTINKTLGVPTSGNVTLIAPDTVSQTIIDSIAVNSYAEKIISCIAGGKESFVANSGMAPGERAFAVNTMTQAIGQASAAFGGCSIAGGDYAAAFATSIVWGPSSLGGGNCYIGSNADASIGSGYGCSTNGSQSAIFGFKNTIGSNGNQTVLIGASNTSDFQRTFIGGHGNIATHNDQVILGTFASAYTPADDQDPDRDYFVLGCGTGTNYRKNAFKVSSYGTYGIGTYYQYGSVHTGIAKLATESWVQNEAVTIIGGGPDSVYKGAVRLYQSQNDGLDGFQIAEATGINAVSLGRGTKATADMAFAANNQTTASYGGSAAFGYKTSTTNAAQLVCGLGIGSATTDAYFRVACQYTSGSESIPIDGLVVKTDGEVIAGRNLTINGDTLTIGDTTLNAATLAKLITFINSVEC